MHPKKIFALIWLIAVAVGLLLVVGKGCPAAYEALTREPETVSEAVERIYSHYYWKSAKEGKTLDAYRDSINAEMSEFLGESYNMTPRFLREEGERRDKEYNMEIIR